MGYSVNNSRHLLEANDQHSLDAFVRLESMIDQEVSVAESKRISQVGKFQMDKSKLQSNVRTS